MKFVSAVVKRAGTNFTKPPTSHIFGLCIFYTPFKLSSFDITNLTNLTLQIKNGNDVVRERAIKYLHLKLKTEGGQLLNKEAEVTLFKEIKGCVKVRVVKRMQSMQYTLYFTQFSPLLRLS